MVVKGRTDTMGLGLYVINPQEIVYVEQKREYFAIHRIGFAEPIKIHGTSQDHKMPIGYSASWFAYSELISSIQFYR
jgi:hypothetical protein